MVVDMSIENVLFLPLHPVKNLSEAWLCGPKNLRISEYGINLPTPGTTPGSIFRATGGTNDEGSDVHFFSKKDKRRSQSEGVEPSSLRQVSPAILHRDANMGVNGLNADVQDFRR